MSLISQILPLENIILDYSVTDKTQLFEYISTRMARHHHFADNEITDCLNAREQLGSTALGCGIAIPHGRLGSLKTATGFFIRLEKAIDFDAPDDKPVKLIFVLLVPENATGEHLEVLSILADKFCSASLRESLLTTSSVQTVHDILTV